jgi:tRNA nucleotidyltransferase (CCA-adding enzyme)
VPAEYAALAALVCKLHLLAHTALELKPATVLGIFEQLDAFRRPERIGPFLLACEADKRGRLGQSELAYPQARYLRHAFAAANAVSAKEFVDRGLRGPAIGEAIRQARIAAIRAGIDDWELEIRKES